MSQVFISQEVASVDYTPAIEFGDLVFVTSANDRLSPHQHSLNNVNIMDKIRHELSNFNEDDFLVCTGAPANMVLCGAVLGSKLKKMLVWDNRMNNYFEVKI